MVSVCLGFFSKFLALIFFKHIAVCKGNFQAHFKSTIVKGSTVAENRFAVLHYKIQCPDTILLSYMRLMCFSFCILQIND